MKRVLLTGSRAWTDGDFIAMHLRIAYSRLGTFTLVHGACPTGADALGDRIAQNGMQPVERHPADWDRLGKRAGFVRNQEMVSAGADLCLAFILDGSNGATNCATLARQAGIEVWRFERVSQ